MRRRGFHEGVDRLHVAVTSRLLPPMFRRGLDALSLHEHLDAVQLELPPLAEGRRYTLTAHTLVGSLDAAFQVRPGPQSDLPVVVYHHGIAEMPYDKSFWGIFRTRLPAQAHLVAVRAPFHRSWFDLIRGLRTLNDFIAMCAVSVKLIEAVRLLLVARGARGCLVAGLSLGGFLALMHHIIYGTADRYVPLLAGPDLAHVMLETHYRRFLAPQALERPTSIKQHLNFRQSFQSSDTRRVFPLLARYDLTMLYAYHYACFAAGNIPVATIARGHITGSLSFAVLRAHVLTCLQALDATEL